VFLGDVLDRYEGPTVESRVVASMLESPGAIEDGGRL
jgi:hypothetical protein